MTEIRSITMKVIDHMSVRLECLESTKSFGVVVDKVEQLLIDVSDIFEGRNTWLNRMDFRFSKVAERQSSLEQKKNTNATHAIFFKRRRQ